MLLTEALKGYESRIRYDMYAHSGEEHALELVRVDRPPDNEKQRLQVFNCWLTAFLQNQGKMTTL